MYEPLDKLMGLISLHSGVDRDVVKMLIGSQFAGRISPLVESAIEEMVDELLTEFIENLELPQYLQSKQEEV